MAEMCECTNQDEIYCTSCYTILCKKCNKVIRRGSRRNPASQKYRMVKKMKHRAITFKAKAETVEEQKAWQEVIDWFVSILNPKNRVRTARGAIGLKNMEENP